MSIRLDEEPIPENYSIKYDYTQYSHDNHVNVIPEEAFQNLVHDTFSTIANVLRNTYGPYGSTIMITEQNQTTTTKDGYNIYHSLHFSHQYKDKIYLTIRDIIDRVNRNVGDGTTSCILLAEKVFNKIRPLMKTSEDKRHLKEILDNIELELQDSLAIEHDLETGSIVNLTKESLRNIIRVASNYDDKLVDFLTDALDPQYDGNDVKSIRNIVVEPDASYDSVSTAAYKIEHIPGDYHQNIEIEQRELALAIDGKNEFRVLMYDHKFGLSEWNSFFNTFDDSLNQRVLIIAPRIDPEVLDGPYMVYAHSKNIKNVNTRRSIKSGMLDIGVNIILSKLVGDHIQDKLHDLAAVLDIPLRNELNIAVNCDEIPTRKVGTYHGNCFCVYDAEPPVDYIKQLEYERDNSKSFVQKTLINDRINDVSMKTKDSIIKVHAGTRLELTMVEDRIEDCRLIVKSALDHGVVPNMFWYGNKRINDIEASIATTDTANDEYKYALARKVCEAIKSSIKELANDVWDSKHCGKMQEEFEALINMFYDSKKPLFSFDVISDKLIPMNSLPTSSQYDIEVLVATLSIVKYLLTVRALIFDGYLLQSHGDQGHFVHD